MSKKCVFKEFHEWVLGRRPLRKVRMWRRCNVWTECLFEAWICVDVKNGILACKDCNCVNAQKRKNNCKWMYLRVIEIVNKTNYQSERRLRYPDTAHFVVRSGQVPLTLHNTFKWSANRISNFSRTAHSLKFRAYICINDWYNTDFSLSRWLIVGINSTLGCSGLIT
jgi:hypothetical protein